MRIKKRDIIRKIRSLCSWFDARVFPKKLTLKLVIPRRKTTNTGMQEYDLPFSSLLLGDKKSGSIMYAIPILAGLTPKRVRVIVQDEDVEPLNFDEKVDLVGITANVTLALRAYEIADEYRKRGVTVIIGGIHSSFFQDEALLHADAIVVGEAENVWRQVVDDYENGTLKRVYESAEPSDINKQPFPRYDLINMDAYAYYTVQTVVGCSSACDYCAIHTYPKGSHRYKDVDRVVEEVSRLTEEDRKLIYFCDSNFAINFDRAKALMRKLIPLNIEYVTQARLEMYHDDELLALMHESGCANVVIGLETIQETNLRDVNKTYSVDVYHEAIQKIQAHGILITGSFMFGFDNDDVTVFERTSAFIKKVGLGAAFLNIVTPLPGTVLYERLEKEGRLLHKNWTLYDFHNVCFRPQKMTAEELRNGYHWVCQDVFSLENLHERVMNIYKTWNEHDVRKKARLFPLMVNYNSHYVSTSYPVAKHPTR